jgi:hypothetical protein
MHINASTRISTLVLVEQPSDWLLVLILLPSASTHLSFCIRYHLDQFLLSPVPFYLGPFPLVYLLPVALKLLLAAQNLLVKLSFPGLLLF